jgi:hypothetical protein
MTDIEPLQTPEASEVVREAPAPIAPTSNVHTLVVGTKRRLFLSSEDEDPTPKKAKNSPIAKSSKGSEDERDESSPSPEPPAVEPPSAKRHKAKASSAVSELDMTPQAVTKHGYPEGAYLLNSKIYIGVRLPLFCFVLCFADLVMLHSTKRSFIRRCASGAPSTVTPVVGILARCVAGVFAIGRRVFRRRVSALQHLRIYF